MPTGYGKRLIFQQFVTAVLIKKVHKEQHSDTVVLALANQNNSGSGKGRKITWPRLCCDLRYQTFVQRCERQSTSDIRLIKTRTSTCNLLLFC